MAGGAETLLALHAVAHFSSGLFNRVIRLLLRNLLVADNLRLLSGLVIVGGLSIGYRSRTKESVTNLGQFHTDDAYVIMLAFDFPLHWQA